MSWKIRHYFAVTTFLLFLDQFALGAKFLLTVPEKPHYDSQYTATVTAYDVYGRETVSLEYRGLKDRSRLINSTTLNFEYDGVKTWTVTFPWALMESYEENAVTLTLATLSHEEKKTLYFCKDTGFIFIQTDKPIYTPRQTVKFRIIAVDEYQRMAKYPIKVDIRNEKMIVMDRMLFSAEEAFKAQDFELPKETPPGIWTISANYEGMNHVQSNPQKVTFEVREYVLPRFSASVKINNDVITKDTVWLTFDIDAKYVYGHYALGTFEMQLGIWDPKTGVEMLPQRYNGTLRKGKFKKHIRINKLIPKEMIIQASRRLYVSVNVTEDGTGENDTIVDTSTFIAHPYYDITFIDSKLHFKPGYPYTLQTQVHARSGRPASWLKLYCETRYLDARGNLIRREDGRLILNSKGKNITDFEIPANAENVKFKITALDFKAGSNNQREFTVPKLKSDNSQYIHIAMIKPIKKTSDGLVRLRYTPRPMFGAITRITVMVVAKGHKVLSKSLVRNREGMSLVRIPMTIYADVSPSMRIVASFYHTSGTHPEFVIDSLKVDTDDVCLEELTLRRPGGFFSSPLPKKPKEKYNLQVSGGPGMDVGFVAVDEAIFLLNDARTLTRESMFQHLASHDQGKGIGDGTTLYEVLKNSGLVNLFIDNDVSAANGNGNALGIMDKVRGNKGPGTFLPKFKGNGGFLQNVIPDNRVRQGPGTFNVFDSQPPQTARNYFPESWLFEEFKLPKSGKMALNLTLPDSITTWNFMAVGLSARRGICVSEPLQQKVQKMFFVDVRLPYKVTRLEEIKVKVAVYNFHTEDIEVGVRLTGDKGLCFSANRYRGTDQGNTNFTLKIGKQRTKSRDVKVIPLENGELTLRVDAYNINERDIVEKNLYVVAEGQRMRKSLTFVLDPEAKHASFQPKKWRKVMLSDTATIKNEIDLRKKTQKTKVDLAMPREIIRGTENCKISAFGDLMGDIINHAVIKSKSLLDNSVQNAEEVLGDLGPTVHALLYANMSGLMDKKLGERARKFVRHGVARLLKYRKEQAFSLTPTSPEGTWLTTAVLKTLCRSSKLAFIDKAILIDHGFYWLLNQVDPKNGTLKERDWRLAKDSLDYQVMLSAEVLIAILECERYKSEDHESLLYQMAYYLEDNLKAIQEPMVLAKVAYALTLFERFNEAAAEMGSENGPWEGEGEMEELEDLEEGLVEGDEDAEFEPEPKASEEAVKKLAAISKINSQGQVYWSTEEVNEDKRIPFWYRRGVKASAIEATAYALLVFLDRPGANVDAIADWLVAQRNQHGCFIGALDSMAAIQALSSYSLVKTGLKVDLSCNVTSDKTKHYSHSFKFTEQNAIRPESLNNVPVGHSLDVLTKGQGLGQMQINVEYNVPIDPNEKCSFNVTIEAKRTEVNFYPDMHKDPMCMSCSWWCRPLVDNTTLNANLTGNDTSANSTDTLNTTATTPDSKGAGLPSFDDMIRIPPPPRNKPKAPQISIKVSGSGVSTRRRGGVRRFLFRVNGSRRKNRNRNSRKNNNNDNDRKMRRIYRSVRSHSSASRRSICVKVCLQHIEMGKAGHTRVDIDMLTGYKPVTSDVEMIKHQPDVLDAWFAPETDKLVVVFKEVSNESHACLGFRAVDHEEVGRVTPANVLVTEVGNPAPSCALEYRSPSNSESLQVYCAEFSNQNRGECRCYSGICSRCSPMTHREDIGFRETKELVCNSDVGYQLQVTDFTDRDQWVEIDAKIVSVNKTGSHDVKIDDSIKMMSPASCMCPLHFGEERSERLYMISRDVEKMVDRYGKIVNHYLLDEQSVFLRVSEPETDKKTTTTPRSSSRRSRRVPPTVNHVYLQQSFSNCPP